MEIEPERQKTRPDFAMTEQLWGVRAIDIGEVVGDGRRLFYRRDGGLTPIRRIYNRVIPDELEQERITLPFDYRDDLDVEWAGHPDWFFRISKFSIPWLRHPSVPRTWFLHEVDTAARSPRERTAAEAALLVRRRRHRLRADRRAAARRFPRRSAISTSCRNASRSRR